MSIATAMNSYGGGEIHTCDSSNEITIFQYPPTKIFQYEGKSSTEMFANLSGYFDFVFLDGRLNSPDIPRLAELLSDHSIITLDDFEGSEKGVANLFNLRTHTRFQNFFLVYPPSNEIINNKLRLSSRALTAVLLPPSLITLTNQG